MTNITPRAPIRRIDVFAEYSRLRAIKEEGLSAAKAKGYGLWVAKVVAAQKFGRMLKPTGKEKREREKEAFDKRKWHKLNGKPQTDELFDSEIVNRMGKDFYVRVFSAATRKPLNHGKKYVGIRDTIRAKWKPD